MDDTRRILETAIDNFNKKDKYLIENCLSERCICSRLAFHIQQELIALKMDEYTADVEYNRVAEGKDKMPKTLHNKKIVVDLIVHKRGCSEYCGDNNLFCIEMKKSNNYSGYDENHKRFGMDKKRLIDMIEEKYGYNYKRGYMVVIDMKEKKLIIDSEILPEDVKQASKQF